MAHAGIDLVTLDSFVEGLGHVAELGGRWIRWQPTTTGSRLGALAPYEQRVREPRVRTCLTSS